MEFGLIGKRLGHSFSKEIHENISSYNYILKEIQPADLNNFILSKEYRGLNVTIPYKQDVIPMLDFVSDRAKAIGAVNTIINKNGVLYGDNTDFAGMVALIEKCKFKFNDSKVLILGSGGTSKTAYHVSRHLGASMVKRVSRNPKKIMENIEDAWQKDDLISYEEAISDYKDADYIINTTPAGMLPNVNTKAISISEFINLKGVLDAVCNPLRSQLVLEAQNNGIPAFGGLYMCVAQAVYASEQFIDKKFNETIIDNAYKKVLSGIRNIVLIGMPTCGKTTVGKILSEDLNMNFYDCDDEIEKKSNKKISNIFKDNGEDYFRNLESNIIKELSLKKKNVISTGGGSILRLENIINLKRNGILVFIDRSLDNLCECDSRPLSSNKNDLINLYNSRIDKYKKAADVIVDGNGTPFEVAKLIEEKLGDL